jgi:hypothetical protein
MSMETSSDGPRAYGPAPVPGEADAIAREVLLDSLDMKKHDMPDGISDGWAARVVDALDRYLAARVRALAHPAARIAVLRDPPPEVKPFPIDLGGGDPHPPAAPDAGLLEKAAAYDALVEMAEHHKLTIDMNGGRFMLTVWDEDGGAYSRRKPVFGQTLAAALAAARAAARDTGAT